MKIILKNKILIFKLNGVPPNALKNKHIRVEIRTLARGNSECSVNTKTGIETRCRGNSTTYEERKDPEQTSPH